MPASRASTDLPPLVPPVCYAWQSFAQSWQVWKTLNMKLPTQLDPVYFDEIYRLRPELWRDAIRQVCLAHQISAEAMTEFSDGSNLVAAVGRQTIVKIFPPFHRHQWESERRVLRHLGRRIAVPIPLLIAEGEREDYWTYLILSRLPGVTLEVVWPECSRVEKASLLHKIGSMMADVHSVPFDELITLDPEWKAFLAQQVNRAAARHERLGMPKWFHGALDTFVQENLGRLPGDARPVVLTGEYTPFNLLVEGPVGALRFSGMIDFGDAMVGLREYDFLGPIMFLAAGDASLVQSLLQGYGYTHGQIGSQLRRKLMLLQILHRYSNFSAQLKIPDWQKKVNSIEELEELIWPL